MPISPPGSRWAERNSFALLANLPKEKHQKSASGAQSKNRRQDEPELHQIAVNCGKYNQIAVVNFFCHRGAAITSIIAGMERCHFGGGGDLGKSREMMTSSAPTTTASVTQKRMPPWPGIGFSRQEDFFSCSPVDNEAIFFSAVSS